MKTIQSKKIKGSVKILQTILRYDLGKNRVKITRDKNDHTLYKIAIPFEGISPSYIVKTLSKLVKIQSAKYQKGIVIMEFTIYCLDYGTIRQRYKAILQAKK